MEEFYDDTIERHHFLDTSVKDLDRVNKEMARLLVQKDQLVEKIIGALGHEHAGQKTYEYSTWRIEIKTPFVYMLDKKKYESGDIVLPAEFNPIKTSISYTIDKRMCEKFMNDAPDKVRKDLAKLIDLKPGKKGVVLRERI